MKLVTCTTSSHYTDSHHLVRSPWISTKKRKKTNEWQDCFVFVFLILCSCPESQRLHQSLFHLPVSTLALSSLQDTPVLTLPSSSLPHPWLHTDNMMVKGGGRFLKKGAPKTERLRALWTDATEQLLAASGNVKAQHFFTEETPHFHGRWNLERQTQKERE